MATGNILVLEVSRFKGPEMDQVNPIMEVPSIIVISPILKGVTGFFLQQTTEIPGSCWTMLRSKILEGSPLGMGSS